MLELILTGLLIAVAGYTYSQILTQAGMIFNGLYNLLDKWIGFGTSEKARVPWLFYPLIYCPKCVSGQLALWGYFLSFPHYNLLHHVLLVTLAVYLVKFVEQAYKWQPNTNR